MIQESINLKAQQQILYCERHPKHPILFICGTNQAFICQLCILEPRFRDNVKDFVVYKQAAAQSVAKFLQNVLENKFE